MAVRKGLLALALAIPLAVAACSNDKPTTSTNSGGTTQGKNLTFAMVSHGSAGDKFWDVVKNGFEQAGKDLGIKVTYQSSGEPQKQSQLIDAAVSQKVDGLIVSMANPDALKSSIEAAVKAGIPVITINSGVDKSAQFGALAHVGQTETAAGQGAGRKFAAKGVKHLVCVVHEAGNIGLEQRCAGARATFGGTVDNLQVNVSDLAGATNTIAAKLQADASIDAVLTLNNGVASVAVNAAAKANRGNLAIGTFDVDSTVLDAIAAGKIFFAVDQQPYVQGYLPVVQLYLYRTNGNTLGGGQPVLTGPSFIDSTNIAQVKQYAQQGTR